MNIKEVLERIEECRKFPNRGLDSKQLTVLRYILEPLSQESECISFKGHGWDILVPGPQSMRKCIYCGKIEDMPSYDKVQADANRKPYQMAYDISHPDVIDLATEKAFNAGMLFEREIRNNQK